MIILGSAIAKAIKSCRPNRIAVAYVGVDWNRFIENPRELEAIVISPTLGTNPAAVDELVKVLHWEKVFFLDELHAKIYLGKSSAVMGSANLTSNGLSGEALIECCTTLSAPDDLRLLEETFESILAAAKKKYPDKDDKIARLAKLRTDWNIAYSSGVISPRTKAAPSIDEFDLNGSNNFYVSWEEGEQVYSDVMSNHSPLISTSVLPKDKVERGMFVLLWQKQSGGDKVARGSALSWLRIDKIVHNGFIEKPYSTCIFQCNDGQPPAVPFEISKEVVRRFRRIISSGNMYEILVDQGKNFYLTKTTSVLKELVSKLKKDDV